MTKKKVKSTVKADTRFKDFWRQNDRFADLFNATVFQGEPVLASESLHERDTEVSAILGIRGDEQGIQRSRDIMKESNLGGNFLLLGIENQMHTHYGMPLKALTYDMLGYIKQCEEITHQRKKNRELKTSEEFLSGLKATDLLQPIITLVLYYGEEPWSGPLTMKDMLTKVSPEVEKLIVDYKMILVQVQGTEEYKFQNKEVATVFHMTRELFAGNIEEVKERYKEEVLSSEVLGMIGTITGSSNMIAIAETEGETNMCKALDEYWDKAKKEGHREIVKRMLENNLPEETICILAAITKEELRDFTKV